MLRVRKSAVGWAVALALTAAGLTPASPAAARPQPGPTIDWRPCEQDDSAECGTLSLPVDWNRPRVSASTCRWLAGSPNRPSGKVCCSSARRAGRQRSRPGGER
ncbi:hypothetical protein NKG94_32165 [Micromonospora sp. M12]